MANTSSTSLVVSREFFQNSRPISGSASAATGWGAEPTHALMSAALAAVLSGSAAYYQAYGDYVVGRVRDSNAHVGALGSETQQTSHVLLSPSVDDKVAAGLRNVYRSLVSNQMELDGRTQQILNQSLWDLY